MAKGNILGAIALIGLSCAGPASAEILYSLTDMGTLGGTSSRARDINDSGLVVGDSPTVAPFAEVHAASFFGSVLTDLGTLGGTISNCYGVNASGTIVGASYFGGLDTLRAFSYNGGTMTDLGVFDGGTFSSAAAISASGVAVGQSDLARDLPGYHAVKW